MISWFPAGNRLELLEGRPIQAAHIRVNALNTRVTFGMMDIADEVAVEDYH